MAYRTDNNQLEIVAALRKAGATVAILSGLGVVPDLLVGWRGINLLIEVKNPQGRGVRLTPAQKEFRDTWGGQIAIVRDVTEALQVLKIHNRPFSPVDHLGGG